MELVRGQVIFLLRILLLPLRVGRPHLRVVPKSVLLLDLPALLLLPQQGEDLLELVVLLPVGA